MRKVLVLCSLAIFIVMFAGCTVGKEGVSSELTAKIDKLTETVKTLETDLATVKANLDSLVVKYNEHVKPATSGRTGGTTGGTGSTGTPGTTTPKLPPKTQVR